MQHFLKIGGKRYGEVRNFKKVRKFASSNLKFRSSKFKFTEILICNPGIASECEPMTDMRGSSPTEDCLAQWSATPEPQAKWTELLDESFAASLALAALAFYA